MTGLEPARVASLEPKSSVSANSTTSACISKILFYAIFKIKSSTKNNNFSGPVLPSKKESCINLQPSFRENCIVLSVPTLNSVAG